MRPDIHHEDMEFLNRERKRMIDGLLEGSPDERRLWLISMGLSGPVVLTFLISLGMIVLLSPTKPPPEIHEQQEIIHVTSFKRPEQQRSHTIRQKKKKLKIIPIPDPDPMEPEPVFTPVEQPPMPDTIVSDQSSFPQPIIPVPPSPRPVQIVRGVNGEPPIPVRKVMPEYPTSALKLRLQGTVILELVVKKDGTVGNIRLLNSLHPLLNQTAMDAARQWHFRPGMVNGRPVDAYFILTFRFQIPDACSSAFSCDELL